MFQKQQWWIVLARSAIKRAIVAKKCVCNIWSLRSITDIAIQSDLTAFQGIRFRTTTSLLCLRRPKRYGHPTLRRLVISRDLSPANISRLHARTVETISPYFALQISASKCPGKCRRSLCDLGCQDREFVTSFHAHPLVRVWWRERVRGMRRRIRHPDDSL